MAQSIANGYIIAVEKSALEIIRYLISKIKNQSFIYQALRYALDHELYEVIEVLAEGHFELYDEQLAEIINFLGKKYDMRDPIKGDQYVDDLENQDVRNNLLKIFKRHHSLLVIDGKPEEIGDHELLEFRDFYYSSCSLQKVPVTGSNDFYPEPKVQGRKYDLVHLEHMCPTHQCTKISYLPDHEIWFPASAKIDMTDGLRPKKIITKMIPPEEIFKVFSLLLPHVKDFRMSLNMSICMNLFEITSILIAYGETHKEDNINLHIDQRDDNGFTLFQYYQGCDHSICDESWIHLRNLEFILSFWPYPFMKTMELSEESILCRARQCNSYGNREYVLMKHLDSHRSTFTVTKRVLGYRILYLKKRVGGYLCILPNDLVQHALQPYLNQINPCLPRHAKIKIIRSDPA